MVIFVYDIVDLFLVLNRRTVSPNTVHLELFSPVINKVQSLAFDHIFCPMFLDFASVSPLSLYETPCAIWYHL